MAVSIKKIVKYGAISLAALLILLTLAVLSLQLPAVQNALKDRLVVYLQNKVKTKVSLDHFYVDFPNNLVMENLYLQGQTVDTLLYARKFDVGLNIPKLLKNTVDLTSIDLAGVRANVVRNRDGSFNYDYFVKAFARKDSQESSSKPFIISLDKIKMQDMGVSFIDNQSRNDISLYFKSFDTRVKTFDLDKNSYAVDNINWDGLRLKLQQDLVQEVAGKVADKADSLRQKKPMKIALNSVKFTNFNVDYSDQNTKTFAKILFGELSSRINKIDIENKAYDLQNIYLKSANINAKMYSPAAPAKAKKAAEKTAEANKSLDLLLGKVIFDDVKLAYSNTAFSAKPRGMDFNHLDFSKLNTEIRNLKIQKGTYAGTVNSAEIKEKNNLDVRKFNTDFLFGEKQAFLKSLYLETSRSVLRDEVVLDYNSQEQLSANPGAVRVLANIKNSKIGFADILNFAPNLRNTTPFNKFPNAILNVDARARGTMNNLTINNLQASGLGDLKLALNGSVKNATDPKRLFYDLNIRNFGSSAKTIYQLLPPNTLPANISLPSHFALNGVAKGTTQVINANLKLASSLGNAAVKAVADLREKGRERYDVLANLQNFAIGKIIQNKDLGMVTGTVAAKGQGFDFKTNSANIKANISSADYKNYRYRNVLADAGLNRGAYNVHVLSKDPNANLNITASGIYNEKNPTVKLNGNLVKVDLQRLGFYKDPMVLAGKLDGEFTNLNPDFLNGYLNLDHFAIADGKEVYPLQEASLKAVSTAEGNSLSLNSQIADVHLTGKYKLTQIFGALQQTVNSYYHFAAVTNKRIDPHQHFDFNAKIKDDNLIRKFLPDLKSFETITLTGNYDADSQKINIDGQIPQLTYGTNHVENAALKINNDGNALQYSINAAKISSEKFALNKATAEGNIANNTVTYHITTKDGKDVEQYRIAGTLQSVNGANRLSLDPDGLKLNYTDWTVAPGNMLQFGGAGILAENFALANGTSQIIINSEGKSPNSPLNVELMDFKIETLTAMVKKDTLLAKGTVNGHVIVKDLKKNMTFNSDLNVADFEMYGNPVGNIAAKINSKTAKTLYADIALSGFGNDAKITGDYDTSSGTMDMHAALNRLQMKSVQGFSMNAITHTEGYLSGDLDIRGTAKSPNVLGKVKFNDVGMEITKTGSNFRHMNDAIAFQRDGISFDNFRVNDPDGNALTLDGKILTTDYRDFKFDMTAHAKDFKLVDAKPDNDKMMYGILAVNANLTIGGNLDMPKVDGKVTVADNTDFTFVVPQTTPTMKDREGIVEFIDQDQVVLNKTIKADSAKTVVKGMNVNVNISLTKAAKISLLIDKSNGDFVKLQGEANLTAGVDPSGKTTLVGVYSVDQGAYEMSFSMIKRKFEIQKGSTITWTGEPTSAALDLTAIYKTKAAPIDLLQQQLTTEQLNLYKQRIPFNTLLVLKGELLKPVITFDITTDDKNPAVATEVIDNTNTKLEQLRQDESEMNKQVFALLLLNRFIGENPFQSQSGVSAGTLAKQSVSQILSQQLNSIASDLIAGVDLTFDFDTYDEYSTGSKNERTDLNVNLSKKLLNDRLKITVGSNFAVEGAARQNEQMSNIAGDITADYQLSKDGRYMLRAYRKNQYEVALQGQIVETGVGFVITLDYNKFKDIFNRAKLNKQIRRQQKAADKGDGVVEFKK